MNEIEKNNNDFYNAHWEEFDKIPFGPILLQFLQKYMPAAGSQILEIGSGAGALALWMTGFGHRILCLEPAEMAAEAARRKGLAVLTTRFQDYQSKQKFDFVVAISSLIHIPKEELPWQMAKLKNMLHPEGLAVMTFIEGAGSAYEDPTGKGKTRFFAKYSERELHQAFTSLFHILEIQNIFVKRMQQNFFLLALKANF